VFVKKTLSPPLLLCICTGLSTLLAAQPPRPQDDLFEHVNHEWLRATPIPDDRVTYSAAAETVDRVEQHIQNIVDELKAAPRRSADAQRIVDLYASTVDDEAVERLGLAPVRDDLKRLEEINSAGRAAGVAGHMASIAAGGIFDVTLATEGRRGLVATVRPGGILLPDAAYYLSPSSEMLSVRRDYAQYLVRLYVAAGQSQADAEADAGRVIRLETRLAEAMRVPPSETEPRRATLDEIAGAWPGFDWGAWARPQGLDRARGLILVNPVFFERFAALMSATAPQTLRAWLRGRYLTAMAPYLPRVFSDARFDFFGTRMTGQKRPRASWKRGVSMVSEFMGDAVGREYARRHLAPESLAAVEAISTNMLGAARESVQSSTWLAEADKLAALSRLDRLSWRMGAPDEWRSYAGLSVNPGERLGNLRRLRDFESRYRLTRLRESADAREWLVSVHSVNAFYSPAQHAITLPAGILQLPYFDPEGGAAGNYGAIGAVIGHELSHMLDVRGLAARASGLRAHVAGFEASPGVRINADLTFGENVADLAGLQLAHRAYVRSHPGGSADREFFTGWARIWRGQSRPDFARYANETSPHAPFRVRANGPLMHLDGFYEAFAVRPGDGMFLAPSQRVRIW